MNQISGDADHALASLVETYTTTGNVDLNEAAIQGIKQYARQSLQNLNRAYDAILAQLEIEHAQIRLLSWKLFGVLFLKSKIIRKRFEEDVRSILKLVVGHDISHPLPLPKSFAKLLREKSLEDLNAWAVKYPEMLLLKRAVSYLQREVIPYLIPLGELSQEERLELRRSQSRHEEEEKERDRKYAEVALTLNDRMEEIRDNLVAVYACFRLLFPELESENVSTDSNINDQENTNTDSVNGNPSDDMIMTNIAKDDDKKIDCVGGRERVKNEPSSTSYSDATSTSYVVDTQDQLWGEDYSDIEGSQDYSGVEFISLNSHPEISPLEETSPPLPPLPSSSSSSKCEINDSNEIENINRSQSVTTPTVLPSSLVQFAQMLGLGSLGYQLDVELGRSESITQTTDNDSVVSCLRDFYIELTRIHLPYMHEVETVVMESSSVPHKQSLLSDLSQLESEVKSACSKCRSLNLWSDIGHELPDDNRRSRTQQIVERMRLNTTHPINDDKASDSRDKSQQTNTFAEHIRNRREKYRRRKRNLIDVKSPYNNTRSFIQQRLVRMQTNNFEKIAEKRKFNPQNITLWRGESKYKKARREYINKMV